MTAPTPDVGTPILTAAELIAGLGTFPTVTFPIAHTRPVDIAGLCEFIGDPAEFFGFARPDIGAVRDAVARVGATGALTAATMTLLDHARIVVTGSAVESFDSTPVRIGYLDAGRRPAGSDDHWLQMAARTVSRAGADHQLRALRDRDCADGIPEGPDITAPLDGALVLDLGGTRVGVGSEGPMSILDQLRDCGVMADPVRRKAVAPAEVQRAWWVSPRFTTHPVALLAGRTLTVDPNRPSFLEIS